MSTGLGTDDLVTGEAVALDLPAATVGLRLASGLIDVAIQLALLVGCVVLALASVSSADDALVGVAGVVVAVLIFVVLPATQETLTRGRTVGKLALGLRTVRDDAGPISFRHAFTRALIGFVEIWVLYGVPALVCALVNPRGKRVGDLLAGTYVVRARFPRPVVRPAFMPPQLDSWARAADMAPLPDALALAVRQFLDRAGSLDPASRAAIGTDLATRVLTHVAPAPPPGQHPEVVLAAVLAERRRRDEDRLAREAALRARLAGTRR